MKYEFIRFGDPDRPLIGRLSIPEKAIPGVAFLLCRPFGSEAIRSSMLFRALAVRLAREGCLTLSFDYYGTGESPGEGKDQTLIGWQRDIAAADAYLRRRSGAVRCNWFGLGLGATLAARAAFDALMTAHRPAHLVLWEPVEDGRAYGASMCVKHRYEMQRWFRARWSVIRRDLGEAEPALPGIVLGFEIGRELARELGQIDGLPIEALLAGGVDMTVGRPTTATPWPQFDALRSIPIEQPIDWMTNHAADGEDYRNAAIVPGEALQAVCESLHATRPVLL